LLRTNSFFSRITWNPFIIFPLNHTKTLFSKHREWFIVFLKPLKQPFFSNHKPIIFNHKLIVFSNNKPCESQTLSNVQTLRVTNPKQFSIFHTTKSIHGFHLSIITL
jgi:hypothetical protein